MARPSAEILLLLVRLLLLLVPQVFTLVFLRLMIQPMLPLMLMVLYRPTAV